MTVARVPDGYTRRDFRDSEPPETDSVPGGGDSSSVPGGGDSSSVPGGYDSWVARPGPYPHEGALGVLSRSTNPNPNDPPPTSAGVAGANPNPNDPPQTSAGVAGARLISPAQQQLASLLASNWDLARFDFQADKTTQGTASNPPEPEPQGFRFGEPNVIAGGFDVF
jgi:hypothetical protein